jgi:UrcA family protein
MISTLLSGAILTLSLGATAPASAVYLQGDYAHVLYGDLDLGSGGDRQRLLQRIEHAAHLVCEAPGPAPLAPKSSETECLRLATADGVAQMNMIPPRR